MSRQLFLFSTSVRSRQTSGGCCHLPIAMRSRASRRRTRSEATLRRLQPKLRMVANGDTDVNVARTEHAAAVAVTERLAETMPLCRSQDSTPVERRALPARVEPKREVGR